jgi:hypothetical protein
MIPWDCRQWIADYFDDAGYVDWDQNSQFYKAMGARTHHTRRTDGYNAPH